MKIKLICIFLVFLFLLTIIDIVTAQNKGFSEQLIGWLTVNPDDPFKTQLGLRYIPSIITNQKINDDLSFGLEMSVNAYANGLIYAFDSLESDAKIKPYRLWIRFSGKQFEVRAGLQKINFGSATMLRPLMWFDKMDPRDPLQLTDGVYSVLGRYYFLNNANIWLWGLYGNSDTKGWEIFPSNKKKAEVGGRFQLPVSTIGEIATSYHYRDGVFDGTFADSLTNRDEFSENRYSIDGKFDLGIGLWFEGSLIHQNLDFTDINYSRLFNLGTDYTFNIGNGLTAIAEYFTYQSSKKPLGSGTGINFGAMHVSYPLSIISNLSAIVYYDFTNNELYRFINCSWTYDNWVFYVMGFWNPDNFQIYQNMGNTNLYSGYGAQMMVVFNH
jgi:hypothetical protein